MHFEKENISTFSCIDITRVGTAKFVIRKTPEIMCWKSNAKLHVFLIVTLYFSYEVKVEIFSPKSKWRQNIRYTEIIKMLK